MKIGEMGLRGMVGLRVGCFVGLGVGRWVGMRSSLLWTTVGFGRASAVLARRASATTAMRQVKNFMVCLDLLQDK